MTIGEVEAFLAIYQHKNLSKAAKAIFISQPSLSSKLNLLEKELGYQLFIRGKGYQNVIVTEEGEKFYYLALQYMDIIQQMMSVKKKEDKIKKLRICATNSIGSYLCIPACEMFMNENENIHIEMQDAETEASYRFIEKGKVDLALTPIIDPFSKVPSMTILKEPMVLMCSNVSSYPDMVNLTDIKLENEVYVHWSDEFVRWHKKVFNNNENIKVKVEMMDQLQYFLEKKDKWTLVPITITKNLMKNANVHMKKTTFELPDRIISCIYLKNNSKSIIQKEFLRCFKETVYHDFGDKIEFYIE